jgi:sigma-B regulation protein RsbU (phosphoserine phosphatase)
MIPGAEKMRILIADDDPVTRLKLKAFLAKFGYEVLTANNGKDAWAALQKPDAPRLAILDWMMPEMDGIEVCRRVREQAGPRPPYLILLTSRQDKDSVVAGLRAGADDYISKPFDTKELRARIDVGVRIVGLQQKLAERVAELEGALAHIKRLQGILPICSYCKKVRNDKNYWEQVESYISEHADVRFSHGICPDCLPKVMDEARLAGPATDEVAAPRT